MGSLRRSVVGSLGLSIGLRVLTRTNGGRPVMPPSFLLLICAPPDAPNVLRIRNIAFAREGKKRSWRRRRRRQLFSLSVSLLMTSVSSPLLSESDSLARRYGTHHGGSEGYLSCLATRERKPVGWHRYASTIKFRMDPMILRLTGA